MVFRLLHKSHPQTTNPNQLRDTRLSPSKTGGSQFSEIWLWVKIPYPTVNIPIPTKIGSKTGGAPTNQHGIPFNGFDNNQSEALEVQPEGVAEVQTFAQVQVHLRFSDPDGLPKSLAAPKVESAAHEFSLGQKFRDLSLLCFGSH